MQAKETIPSIVTVGTFDGLHSGHRLLLDTLLRHARHNGLRPLAITFDRHPLETIAPERAPLCLMDTEHRNNLIRQCGVEPVTIEFSRDICSLTAEQWIERMAKDYGARMLVVGYDNTFGSDGLDMSPEDYAALGKKHGIRVVTAPVAEGVSSSAVRKAIAAGRVEDAQKMTGRPYEVTGTVVNGDKIGRKIGFPTANILTDRKLAVPGKGVYAAEAVLPGGEKYPAVVNIGNRPTIGAEKPLRIEANLIGFSGDIYGKKLSLHFIGRLRDEQRFGSLEQLREAIEHDKNEALCLLRGKDCNASDRL